MFWFKRKQANQQPLFSNGWYSVKGYKKSNSSVMHECFGLGLFPGEKFFVEKNQPNHYLLIHLNGCKLAVKQSLLAELICESESGNLT